MPRSTHRPGHRRLRAYICNGGQGDRVAARVEQPVGGVCRVQVVVEEPERIEEEIGLHEFGQCGPGR